MKALLNSLVILALVGCATKKPLPRVKANFYMNFGDDIGRSTLKPDGSRLIETGLPMDEWSKLKGYIAIPAEDYNRLVNRQNL